MQLLPSTPWSRLRQLRSRFLDFKHALEALLARRVDLVDRKAIGGAASTSASGIS
jgi:predicted nucleotidyltransferase